MKTTNTNKKGFTIIEVVLVLAIAGLIFMMVFIALPALQRSQRDTQRSNDMSRVVTALNQYQANNRGAIPTNGVYVKGHAEKAASASTTIDTKSWNYFYDNYLIVSAGGSTDVFADPDGEPYALWIQKCKTTGGKVGDTCDGATQRFDATFDEQSNGFTGTRAEAGAAANDTINTGGNANHSISIVTHATCENEIAMYSTGSRKVAIVYKKEGGGTFCLNN